MKFEAEPTVPAEVEKRMRIMDNVERYLIVSDDDEVHLGAPVDEEPDAERQETRGSASRASAPAEEAPAAGEAAAEEPEETGSEAEEAAGSAEEGAPEETGAEEA